VIRRRPRPPLWRRLLGPVLGLLVALAAVAGLTWGARLLCTMSPDCPWTVLYR
jgi:hypothetical protein